MKETITSRYRRIADEVFALASHRDLNRNKIKLIVVTKRQTIDACLEVITAGAKDLGENYAEEAAEKYKIINKDKLNFHLIGHLQSRKIKYLCPTFSTIQTLDSLELTEKVNQYFLDRNESINALIEINLTNEINKSGFKINSKKETELFFETFGKIILLSNIKITGLMTMGYFPETEETNRVIFRKAFETLILLKEKFKIAEFDELSMGTSGDYKTAIEEGATMVRIGEKIMGSRDNQENV